MMFIFSLLINVIVWAVCLFVIFLVISNPLKEDGIFNVCVMLGCGALISFTCIAILKDKEQFDEKLEHEKIIELIKATECKGGKQ